MEEIVDADIAHAGIGTARVFLYGDVDLVPAVLSGTIGYTHDWFASHRDGSPNYLTAMGAASQSHEASEYSAGLQLKFPTAIGEFQVNPKTGLQYADIDEAGFREHGADQLNLSGDSHNRDSLRSFIRVDMSRQVSVANIILTPRLDAGYARELLSAGPTAVLSVAGDSEHPPSPFLSSDIATAGIGINLLAGTSTQLSLDYDANIYVGDGVDHILRLGVHSAF